MSKWEVSLPIVGSVTVEVEADDEDAAIEAALESKQLDYDHIDEWWPERSVNRGNVIHGPIGEARATNIDE